MRAHYTRPITDQQGDLLPNITITVYQPGTTTLVTDVLYSTDSGTNVLTNPFVSTSGIVDIYMDNPTRVRLGVVQGTNPIQYYEDIDVLAAGVDGQHTGAGLNSVQIGLSATSVGNNSVAIGQGANSPGSSGTAVGTAASASGTQSVALGAAAAQGSGSVSLGDAAQGSGDQSVALGQSAVASNTQSAAIGNGATSAFSHSTAIGAGSATTGPNQIMMGTATDVTVFPPGSGPVMSSPNGTQYKLTVDDTGALITTAL